MVESFLSSLAAARRGRRERRVGLAVLIILLLDLAASIAAPAVEAELVRQGRDFARLACGACHRVSADQSPPPPVWNQDEKVHVAARSFMDIVADSAKDAAYLRNVIVRPHYPMKEQRFTPEDLEMVVAYMLSLRTAPSGPSQ